MLINTNLVPQGTYNIQFESFDANSSVQSALRTDVLTLVVIGKARFVTEVPALPTIAGRQNFITLPEIEVGTY